MLSKTHLAIGIATSLTVLQPSTPKEIAVAVIGGAMGGSIPDIDIIKNKTNLDSIVTQSTAALIVLAAVLCDYYFNYGIVRYLGSHPESLFTGIALYVLFCVIGFYAPHRGFTHSFLGMALFTSSVRIIYPELTGAFLLGYASHLVLDLLNRKPMKLFYPIRKGVCLRLCYSNRLANRVLFIIGTSLSIVMLMYQIFMILNTVV